MGGRCALPPGPHMSSRQTPAPTEPETADLTLEVQGLSLHSTFQPVLSVAHGRVIGHEALLRAHDESGTVFGPTEVLSYLQERLDATRVNSLCSRLHLGSFAMQQRDGWLFLNITPRAIGHRATVQADFRDLLCGAGVQPHQLVMEIVETKVHDEKVLAEAVGAFRDLGCLVAIDDFGAGESNFERIWRLQPDLVKIDRAMIVQAARSSVAQRILPGLVSLLHEAGCLVVVEGIETERQALIALSSDADFVQGFHFAVPSQAPPSAQQTREHLSHLTAELHRGAERRAAMDSDFFRCFTGGLEACVSAIEESVPFFDACATFLALAGVQRVYLLDSDGYQIGQSAEAIDRDHEDARFAPCANTTGANWSRRSYFQRAVREPRKVQISHPYLSIRDATTCVTMSLAFEFCGHLHVLCADLDHDHGEQLSGNNIRDSRIVVR